MIRTFVMALVLSCLVTFAWAQVQPAPAPSTAQTTPLAAKPAKKPKASAKPTASSERGPCQIGVIPAIGDEFVVQKVGFTVFGNERAEVPVANWGLNDLVVARVRAAAGAGATVRKLAYAKDAFAQVERPGSLFRDTKAELGSTVQQIAAGSHCERYVLVHSSTSQFSNLNQSVRGIGIVNWGNPVKDHTYLFALTYIRIYDGQGFEVIKQGSDQARSGIDRRRITDGASPYVESDSRTQSATG